MSVNYTDFDKIWASTSPLTPYSFSESNYKQGWNFIGSTPPARQMWDFLQKQNDEKMQYLANNYLPLSGGTMTGDITFSSTDWKIKCNTNDNSLNFWAGTNWSKGAYMSLYGIDHAQYPGWFRLYARNSTTSVELRGKPDGTLTWNGQNILTASNYNSYALPLSGGTINGDLSFTGGSRKINLSNGKSLIVGFGNGVYMYGDTADKQSSFIAFTNENGNGFQINAGNGTTQKRMVGNPDGALTWDGQPLLPVGIVQAFAGNTIPNGWLLCDGSAVSRTTYAKLFAVIGTTYGAGNGSTTFNLPDLTDKFIQGNSVAGTEHSAGLPDITGQYRVRIKTDGYFAGISSPSGAFYSAGSIDGDSVDGSVSEQTGFKADFGFQASRSNSIYGNSTTVQPPAVTMQYIIKY